MTKLNQYIENVSGKVKGKERDSQTAKKLLTLATEAVNKNEPLTIQEAGKKLGIKYPNYLHQVIKSNSTMIAKVKVKGRSLIVPASVTEQK